MLRWLKVESSTFRGCGGVCPFYRLEVSDVRTGSRFTMIWPDDYRSFPFEGQRILALVTSRALHKIRDGEFTASASNSLSQAAEGRTVAGLRHQRRGRAVSGFLAKALIAVFGVHAEIPRIGSDIAGDNAGVRKAGQVAVFDCQEHAHLDAQIAFGVLKRLAQRGALSAHLVAERYIE